MYSHLVDFTYTNFFTCSVNLYGRLTDRHCRCHTYLAIHDSIKPFQLINDEARNVYTVLSNTENHKPQLSLMMAACYRSVPT